VRGDAVDDTAPASEPARAAEPGAARLAVGAYIAGRYRIARFIAAGGMGEVYAAEDDVVGGVVALKVVKAAGEPSDTAVVRLVRELAVARKVTHPNVCRLHDVGEHAGRAFLTMELLDGETLAHRLERGPLPVPLIEAIAGHLIAALAALHAGGVVHRDLKSSNIVLVGDPARPRAVVTDFGLARALHAGADARLTHEGGLYGTPAYMAPEQVEGRTATPASDVYALGVVLFEMATGSLPFEEDTPLATATARLTREAPRARARRPELPAAWDDVIARCLERAPGARPARVEDVLLARPRPRRRARRVAAAVAGAGGLAIASVLLWPRTPAAPAAIASDEACPPAERRLAGVWDADVRARVGARYRASEHRFVQQAWAAHVRQFDAYAAAWAERWDRACALPDRVDDPLLHGQRVACLSTRLADLRWYVDGLAEPTVAVEDVAVGSPGEFPLPPVAECDEVLVLRAQVPPPDPRVRAQVDALMAEVHHLRARIRYAANASDGADEIEAALARLAALRARALELGYPAGAGEIGWWLAEFLTWFGRFEQSERIADEVIALAVRTRDDALLVRMRADQVSHRAQRAPVHDAAAAVAALAEAEVVAARLGSPPSLVESIAEARTMHAIRAGSAAEIVEAYRAFVASRRASGLSAFAARELVGLAVAQWRAGDHAAAVRTARQAVAEREAAVGDAHPLVAGDLLRVAPIFAGAGDLEAADAAAVRSARLSEAVPGRRASGDARTARGLALAYALALGRPEAVEEQRRALVEATARAGGAPLAAQVEAARWLARRGHRAAAEFIVARVQDSAGTADERAAVAQLVDGLAAEVAPVVRGDPAAAVQTFERARAALGPAATWRSPERSVADARVGIALVEAGRPADAIEPLERALRIEAVCCAGEAVIAHDARFALARALWTTGGDRTRARALAERARAGLRRMGPALAARADAVDGWLRAR
jgi:hypothetical protein